MVIDYQEKAGVMGVESIGKHSSGEDFKVCGGTEIGALPKVADTSPHYMKSQKIIYIIKQAQTEFDTTVSVPARFTLVDPVKYATSLLEANSHIRLHWEARTVGL